LIAISGVSSFNNSRHCINIQGCDRVAITGNTVGFSGLTGGSDTGILSNNSLGGAQHTVVGNICTQAGGGAQEYGIYANVTSLTSATTIVGNSCLFNTTADIVLAGQTQNILVANNTFSTFTDVAPTVASASTIIISPSVSALTVTGTTNIGTINTTGCTRKTVTLIFADVLTVTDGNNLKLAGSFTTTADDTLTLYCDGTNWFEVARSVN
jgi:hypothetical protein